MKKGIIIALISIITISVWWKIFIPVPKPKREKITTQVLTQHKEEEDNNKTETFDKKYQVLYGFDDDVSFRGYPRYTRKILVELGLSREELENNLIHAAWELQKDKNAKAVMIFAYRKDDLQRDLYSAGRCTLAPFGDWALATDKQLNSTSNLTHVIDIAEIYFKDLPPMYKIKDGVIVNKHNTKLYKTKDINPDEVITLLRKGTEAIVVDCERNFSSDDFLDIYKIRFIVRGNKTAAGWVFSDNLDKSQHTISITQSVPQKQVSEAIKTSPYTKEQYRKISLYNKTIADWKKAKTEDKIITCEGFIIVAISQNYFKVKMTNINNIRDYAKILADSIDSVSKNSKDFDYINVTDMMAIAANSLGWI